MTLKTLLAQHLKEHSSRLWLAAIMAAGVSLSSVGLLGVSGAFLTGAAIAGAAGVLAVQAFNYLIPSALIRSFAVLRTLLRYGERIMGHEAALRAMSGLRADLFRHLSRADPQVSLSVSRGDASSRLIQDVAIIENAIVMKSLPASALGGVAMALFLSLWGNMWAAMVLSIGLGITWAVTRWIIGRAPDTLSEPVAAGVLKQKLLEWMPVLAEARIYSLETQLMAELDAHEEALADARAQTFGADALAAALNMALMGVTMAVIAIVAGYGKLPDLAHLPGMAMCLLAASMGFESLSALSRAQAFARNEQAAHARLNELIALPETQAAAPAGNRLVYAGQTIGLTSQTRLFVDGPSGSGKTRLIEALIGLRPAETVPHLEAAPDPALFALSPQDAAMLTGTIADNLRMANAAATVENMMAALRIAALDERMAAMPKGLETWVGDGGIALSGGERKRLSLARALISPAPVLILDEPTEGLDATTEAHVIERLCKYLQDQPRGVLLISHRLAPRALCDEALRIRI